MNLELENKGIQKEEKYFMPYVGNKQMPIYCILRLGYKYKSLPLVKGFVKHMTRQLDTPNADPEKLKDNEQLYGAEDLYKDTKNYLSDAKVYSNNVIGREILITATPEFFKGISKDEFELWKNVNIEWLKGTFKDNFRAAYLHLDESTPHIHGFLVCKQWSNKAKAYTLQNNVYFNGIQLLRNMQDNYAEYMQKTFPVLQRGIRGSKAKHVSMKKLYTIMNEAEKETNIEVLQAKAANQELLKKKVNYMDKTIKSIEYFNKHDRAENEKLKEENNTLRKELEELKKVVYSNTIKETIEQDKKQDIGVKRGFSGKRYNKSV